MKWLVVSGWWLVACCWCLTASADRISDIDPVKPGEIRLRPTFVSCGVCWGEAVDGLALEYRKAGTDGEWLRETKFCKFVETGDSRGSIFDLEEDTEYELRVVKVEDGEVRKTASFRTWKSDVPIAETRVIDPVTATFPIEIIACGRPDGWVRYTIPPGTAITNISPANTIHVCAATNVILENIVIYGGGNRHDRSAGCSIFVTNSVAVRFRNCDISNFGRVGTPRFEDSGRRHVTGLPTQGYGISGDAGIRIGKNSSEIVVERCYIHDPRGTANSWFYSHPAGQNAIVMATPDHSTVLRWNDLLGCENHRYDDVVTSASNFSETGGFNRECDVYGNYFAFSSDDIIEFDGGMQNTRCFDNRGEFCFVGVSLQGCMVSPCYTYRNLISGLGDWFNKYGQTIKTGSKTQESGGQDATMFVWENIMMGPGTGMSMQEDLIEKVFDNRLYDSASIGNPAKALPGSYSINNVKMGKSTDQAADPLFPVRPLPFNFDRTRFTGLRVRDDRLLPYEISGTVDVGAAVFRYAGSGPAEFTRGFTNTVAVASSTGAVEVVDLRQDVTFLGGFSSGALPFVKTGLGKMTLEGASISTSFGFSTAQPGTKYPKQSKYANQFSLPADGTIPTQGYAMFSVLDGEFCVKRGTATAVASSSYSMIGGWTAGSGEKEKDVTLRILSEGKLTFSSGMVVGTQHGFANYNTPDGPAKVTIVLDGGILDCAGGKSMYFGSIGAASKGDGFNSELRLEAKNGGWLQRGSTTGTTAHMYVYQRKGQTSTFVADGGRIDAWAMSIGNGATAGDSSAMVDIMVRNDGLFTANVISNNVSSKANPPPTSIEVRDGGAFRVNELRNMGGGRLSLRFDRGTLGNFANSRETTGAKRYELLGENITSVTVGTGGMTIDASTKTKKGADVTAVISSPIVTDSAECPMTLMTTAGNCIEFATASTFLGETDILGDGEVALPSGMTITIDVPTNTVKTVFANISGAGVIRKTGAGTLQLKGTIELSRLEVVEGLVIVFGSTDNIGEIVQSGGTLHRPIEGDVVYADMTVDGDWEYEVASGRVRVVAVQSGAGGIIKLGAGTLALEAENLFTGAIDIRGGTVEVVGSAEKASSLVFAPDTKLVAPSGTVFRVESVYVDDFRIPKGTLSSDGFPFVSEGVTIIITEGEVGEPTDEIPAIEIGEEGSQFAPDDGTCVHSITLERTTPFVIGEKGRTLSVLGGIGIGTSGNEVTFRGTIQGPYGLDQGKASASPSLSVSGTGKITLDDAVITKPISVRSPTSVNNPVTILALANTTNRIGGDFYWQTPTARINVEAGAELEFSGGISAAWGHTRIGAGLMRITGKPYTSSYQFTIADGKTVFDVEGCTFGGRDHTEGLNITGPIELEFARSWCLANNRTTLGITGAKSWYSPYLEFNTTTQRIGRIAFTSYGTSTCLHGDYPAMLEITGGIRPNMAAAQRALVMMMTNRVDIQGGLGIAFRGDLAETQDDVYKGYNESLVLAGRDFSSYGDLAVSGGTLELASDASWLNGTNFIVSGSGVMKFNRADQIGGRFTRLHLADDGRIHIPENVQLQIGIVEVEDSATGDVSKLLRGIYDENSTGPLANRIVGGGCLQITGGKGTMLYFH